MQTTTETNAATAADQQEACTCLSCGGDFTPKGKARGYYGHLFCTDKCRQGFHNRNKSRGGPMAPLVLAWNATRHAKPGTREAEICKFARSQLTAMAREFLDEDQDQERADVVDYVGTMMDSGILWQDRRR